MTGILERYYKQVAYDSFNQTEAAIENKYATELDMKYFIYSGGLIGSSRRFCIKRAGKVFSIEETTKWKCDPDLIGKPKGAKCDESYNPLIDRGRYNCRHTIQYISDEMAFKMRPELVSGKIREEKLISKQIKEPEMFTKEDLKNLEIKEDERKNYESLLETDKKIVVGFRYGKAPPKGYSYNYAENRPELGVSMANVLDINTIQSFAADTKRKIYYYIGELVENVTGGDSEYLMRSVININKKQYKIFCNQMVNEKRILIGKKIKSLEETLSYYRSNYGWHKMMELFEQDLKFYSELLEELK